MSTNESVSSEPLIELDARLSQPPQDSSSTLNPDNPPWSLLQGFLVWAISVAFLLFVPLFLILPYLAYRIVAHSSAAVLKDDPNLLFLSVLGVLPSHLLTFLVVWAVVTNRGRRPFWPLLGWSWPKTFGPWKTIGTAVFLLACGWLITHFLGGAETQLDQIIKSSPQARILIALLAAVTGPLVEELVYRGVLYSAVHRALGVIWAVVIVSVLFAGVHVAQYYNNPGVIAVIAILSVSLTLIRARTGKLLPSYVIHFVFNGIQALILIFQPWIEKSQALQNNAPGMLLNFIKRVFV